MTKDDDLAIRPNPGLKPAGYYEKQVKRFPGMMGALSGNGSQDRSNVDHKAATEAALRMGSCEIPGCATTACILARAYLDRERALREAVAAIERSIAYYRRYNGHEAAGGLGRALDILREKLGLVEGGA
jgi:hypothetical protein